MSAERWTELFGERGEHRFFRDNFEINKRVAICDRSGRTPDLTDSGVLYIDTKRPIRATRYGFSVPLVSPTDVVSMSTVTDTAAEWLIGSLGMALLVGAIKLSAPPAMAARTIELDQINCFEAHADKTLTIHAEDEQGLVKLRVSTHDIKRMINSATDALVGEDSRQ